MIKKQKVKKDLDVEIATKFGVPIIEVKRITSQLFIEIESAVVEYGRIEIRNFGVLRVVNIPAQKRQNPKTLETFTAEESQIVRFGMGKRFKKLLLGDDE